MGELKGVHDAIDFQTAYVADLVKESNYSYDLDVSEMLHAWCKSKHYSLQRPTFYKQVYRSQGLAIAHSIYGRV